MARWEIRAIRFSGNVAFVPLTKGYEAIIDATDAPFVEGWNWHALVCPHAVYAARRKSGSTILLHRSILGFPADLEVDHINNDGLDNRRANLRVATRAENSWNQPVRSSNTSGFKGVYWHKASGKWLVLIRVNGRRIHLGRFDRLEDAHVAYANAARELHGEFARAA